MQSTRRSFLRGVVVAGLGSSAIGLDPTHAFAGAPGPHAGIALGIGLNEIDPGHYGVSGKLRACEADAKDVVAIAKAEGFKLYGATGTLLTKQATRDAVIGAISGIADQLRPGDIFVLHYSGHGGQIPDSNGDESDGKDETWCLYDGQLIDDEISGLWAKFREGVRILLFSDSCHSGTVAKETATAAALRAGAFAWGRDLDERDRPSPPKSRHVEGDSAAARVRPSVFRCLPDDVLDRVYHENRDFYDKILRKTANSTPQGDNVEVKASVLLISGCQDNQLSQDGASNGLFTGTLKEVWGQGSFKGSYQAFHSQIVDRMPPVQSPNFSTVGIINHSFLRQRPFTI